ncbi:hypothetical protein TRFO_32979 [Tritrichomonas foetus]|uniref:Rab-GAP TBC domain-containing protein n=1 Tax=Tritrichomonas foetus TaxID=1144522 RepID=A0A1J4JMN7_9EUKA|nr:hypothetical protein TRFO_32979 [Tritrichomonas foetus]|eukprot:OHT00385.1 hypothetical protein TRFO_32979 [Tritrichomonas foetus]
MSRVTRCWLFDPVPNIKDVQEFFLPNKDFASRQYRSWIKEFHVNTKKIDQYTTHYQHILAENDKNYESYEIISLPNEKNILNDLKRTLGAIRENYNYKMAPNDTEKILFCKILRIILVMQSDEKTRLFFRYRQTMIDLLLPIYHVVWCALYNDDLDIIKIEAITKVAFCKFMKKSKHIYKIPGSPNFESRMSEIRNNYETKLREIAPSAVKILDNSQIDLLYFSKWYFLVFTQEFNFHIVIQIWNFLILHGMDKFNKELIKLCGKVLENLFLEFVGKSLTQKEIYSMMQDIKKVPIFTLFR